MTSKGSLAHVDFVTDPIDIEGEAQATLAVSTSEAATAALTEGIYDLWSDVDTWLKVGTTVTGVTSSTGYLLRANNTIPLFVRQSSKIGAIAGGAGTLRYHKVG